MLGSTDNGGFSTEACDVLGSTDDNFSDFSFFLRMVSSSVKK